MVQKFLSARHGVSLSLPLSLSLIQKARYARPNEHTRRKSQTQNRNRSKAKQRETEEGGRRKKKTKNKREREGLFFFFFFFFFLSFLVELACMHACMRSCSFVGCYHAPPACQRIHPIPSVYFCSLFLSYATLSSIQTVCCLHRQVGKEPLLIHPSIQPTTSSTHHHPHLDHYRTQIWW
ncbi:hypothetical protein BC567DRAFT_29540 [Phyllosticta citribraziliensis]